MKKISALVLALAMCMALVSCGGGDTSTPSTSTPDASTPSTSTPDASTGADYSSLDPVQLIGADSTAANAAGQLFGEMVAEKLDTITGGQLTMDYFPNGELGADADLLRQLQSGDIDIFVGQTAPVASFVPNVAVYDLPMVFATYDGPTIDAVINNPESEFYQGLAASFNEAGLHLLGTLQNATFRQTTTNRDLQTLADYQGMLIRTMENPNHMALWEAMGAAPTPMAWNEVYFALQSGNIEAEENAADTIVGSNLNEVQAYLAKTNHILYANMMIMNKDSYDALDPLYQEALNQAVSEALSEMSAQLADIEATNLGTLEERGMTIIEYGPEFFDEVLALPGVQELYASIDEQTGGLAQILQDELAAAAG